MSLHGSLAGQSWSHFHGISGTSTPSHSPRPPSSSHRRSYSCSNDVMKLPSVDMAIFGICPSQDDFVLVICENCGKRVKMEAFETHNVSRHGSQRQKDARKAMLSDKASALDLIKEDLFSSSIITPLRIQTRPSENEQQQGVETTAAYPAKMEVVQDEEETPHHNVISIPESEPLPAGMSKDLMAMVEESAPGLVVLPSPQHPPSSTTPTNNNNNNNLANSILLPKANPSSTSSNNNNNILPPPPAPPVLSSEVKPSPSKKARSDRRINSRDREYHPDKHCGVWDNDSRKHCTRALTCKSHSVLLKRKIPGRSKSFDELVLEHKAIKEAAARAAAASPALVAPVVAPQLEQPPPTPIALPNGVLPLAPLQSTPGVTTTTNTTMSPPPPSSPPEESLFYTTDHPKPLAVCNFGNRRFGHSLSMRRSDAFTRKVLRLTVSASSSPWPPPNGLIKSHSKHSSLHHPTAPPPPSFLQGSTSSSSSSSSYQGTPSPQQTEGFLLNYNLGSTQFKMAPPHPSSSSSSSTTPQRLSTGGIKLSSLQPTTNPIILQDGFKSSTDFSSGIQFEFGK